METEKTSGTGTADVAGWRPGKNGGRLKNAPARTGPNRATISVRAAVTRALEHVGGWRWFVKLAESRHMAERIAFANVAARVVPLEVHGQIDATLRVLVQKIVLAGDAKNGALGASIGAIEHVSPMTHVPYTGKDAMDASGDARVIEGEATKSSDDA